jgi:hypothetical protein
MRRIACLLTYLLLLVPTAARAWGLEGHRIIGVVAMRNLPATVPSFLQTQATKDQIIYLQSEEDRLKIGDSQAAWDREWPTDHYLDVDDNDMIGGVVALSGLPATRDQFEQLLARAPQAIDAYNVGFLPYAILEGYEQVRSDFALWRQADSDARLHPSPQSQTVKTYREQLTIHDIGIFSHFVGDGSQPLHVTIHYNGWGNYPNPQQYSTEKNTHAEFESDWVSRYINPEIVNPLFRQPTQLSAIPLPEIERYLAETNAQVIPFYQLKARGGFDLSDSTSAAHQQALQFTAQRLAAASQMLDSLIITAWQTSSTLQND